MALGSWAVAQMMEDQMRFAAREKFEYSNDAIGWAPGGPMDCLGPFAKVQNCPVIVDDREFCRLTCYATGYPNSYFSVPACTRYRGKYVRGYLTTRDVETSSGWRRGVEFRVYNSSRNLFPETW